MFIELLRKKIADLTLQRDAAVDKIDAFAATLLDEKRDATDAENTEMVTLRDQAKTLTGEISDLRADLDERLQIDAARKASAKFDAPAITGRAGGGDNPYDIELRSAPRTPEVRRDIESRALRAIEIEDDLSDDNKAHVERMLRNKRINRGGALARHILTTGRPEYRDAFIELSLRAQPILTAEQADAVKEIRGLQITTDASGGYLMPFTLDPTIILTNNGVVNPIRQLATVNSVATDNWQGITSAGVTASYDAEESEVSDDTPTLAQPSIAIHQGQAFVPFSVQAEDDFASLSSELADAFADAKDRLELNAFTLGTGTGQPFGLITEATVVATTTADTFVRGDVYKLQQAVAPRHRRNGVWMANLNVLNLIAEFDTGSGSVHRLLTDGPVGVGASGQIRLQAAYENSEMDGVIDAAASNKILAYGDFKKYRIHDRIGMTVELVPYLFGANRRPTGQRGWYSRFRHGARLIDAAAVKVLDA